MKIKILPDSGALGKAAGIEAGALIRHAIMRNGKANVILATGTSQFETIRQLVQEEGIDWGKVSIFHLDEYIGLSITHQASFRKYLTERFLAKVTTPEQVFLINGEGDVAAEIRELSKNISENPIDVALVGIGENGHLAFNDPPADFETEEPYLVVNLDEPCRMQQLGEGWFNSLTEVPKQAISMSIRQIMKAKHIVCSVPDERKAQAVQNCLTNEVSNLYPASILQNHSDCTFFLDKNSAKLLSESAIGL